MIFKGIDIRCPHCKGDLSERFNTGTGAGLPADLLEESPSSFHCASCDRSFPVILGIPDLRVFPDPYITVEADQAKGLQVAARFDDLSFPELVDFYYSITSVVPPQHARSYTRGLLTGVDRAKAALASWDKVIGTNYRPAANLLEIGCGTAPLLVAAAPQCANLVGVDIAFRWLVVGKKRLAEAGLDIPLICACAEALPFSDDAFDRVVADSVLEHVREQRTVLAECHRVMRSTGHLFVSTPNRYSLGPDPHAGIWAGGFLPDRWVAAYVRWQGGIPPKRRLLSPRSLSGLIREAGFSASRILLPDVSEGQRTHFGRGIKLLIDFYHAGKRLPVTRRLLRWIGPLLHAVAEKPAVPFTPRQRTPG